MDILKLLSALCLSLNIDIIDLEGVLTIEHALFWLTHIPN